MPGTRKEDVAFCSKETQILLIDLKMMWLIAAILVILPSATSAFEVKLTLNASNPTVIFHTPNYPRRHKSREKGTWVVSAPGNVDELHVTCDVNIEKSGFLFNSWFYFYDYDKEIYLYGTETRSMTINGSTSIFKFQSNMCFNFRYKGVNCTVSYNPEDIPTCTTPVDPSCTCGNKGRPRIVGGKITSPNEYPWQALLVLKLKRLPFCGGSVIAKQWVLSAAHCVKSRRPFDLLVVLGEHDIESRQSSRQDFNVTEIIRHHNFGQIRIYNNDIALLKLEKQATFNHVISPICLPFNYKYYDFTDKTGTTTGWGKTIIGKPHSYFKILKEIDQKMIMPYKCTLLDGYSWHPIQITRNMICAQVCTGCNHDGDSGGPLVWKSESSNLYFQLGVVSFGDESPSPTRPSVYTRVSRFVDWIVEKTGDEFCIKI